MGAKGQLVGIASLLPPSGIQGLNLEMETRLSGVEEGALTC